MTDFPKVVDSTLLASARACGAKANMAYFEHYKPTGISVHLHAGKAYAEGLERARRSFYEGGFSAVDAVAHGGHALMGAYGDYVAPEGSAKTLDRMLGALEFHFERYPLGADGTEPIVMANGRRAIEFSGAEPLPIAHPTTGEPLVYSWRADQVVNFADGVWVHDDKTSTSLGTYWQTQWDLRSQFTAYCWGAAKQGIKVTGVLVRGVSILKTRYDTLQHTTYRPQWMIDRWLVQTVRDLERLIAQWKSGVWDYNLDDACTSYGGCQFRQVCMAEDPGPWLKMGFDRRIWDPLKRTETPLTKEN
jgi:hypothetical protein